jgi:hypothetical protein
MLAVSFRQPRSAATLPGWQQQEHSCQQVQFVLFNTASVDISLIALPSWDGVPCQFLLPYTDTKFDFRCHAFVRLGAGVRGSLETCHLQLPPSVLLTVAAFPRQVPLCHRHPHLQPARQYVGGARCLMVMQLCVLYWKQRSSAGAPALGSLGQQLHCQAVRRSHMQQPTIQSTL